MTDADDWAPLPEEQRISHPGELQALQARPRAAQAPSIPPGAAPRVVETEPDPVAEQAINDLKARIANSAPSTSLVAEVLHREARQERQKRAASAPFAADAATQPSPKGPRDLPIEYDAGAHGRDQREEEPWFKALPAEERKRLQVTWAEKRQHVVSSGTVQRRNGNRRFVAAVYVFAAAMVAGTGIAWAATVGAGICCGIWWRHSTPDRFLDPLRALGCFYGMHAVAMAAHGAISPLLFLDTPLLVGFAVIVGFDGEIRRSGGFDSK